jgi:hypothetical protein
MKLSDISIREEHLRRLLLDRCYLTQISYPLKETSVNSYFHSYVNFLLRRLPRDCSVACAYKADGIDHGARVACGRRH